MKHRKYALRVIVIGLVLFARLMSPFPAYADDSTPPPPSEIPTADPTKPGVDLIPTEAVFTDPVETSTPTPPANPTEPATEPTSPGAIEESETPVLVEVLQKFPKDTNVVVLDESGQPLTLAAQATADTIAHADPMWCPEGVAPGGLGCTSAYATLTDLLSNAGTYIDSQSVNGVIWITSGAIGDTNAIVIDGLTYTNWANHGLILQGGWSGMNGDTTIGANSAFFVPITIANWNNGITIDNVDAPSINLLNVSSIQGKGISVSDSNSDVNLDNLQINRALGTGLYITTTGFINASNISSLNNVMLCGCVPSPTANGDGAYMIAGEGIALTGTNNFNYNFGSGLFVGSDGDIILENVNTTNNHSSGVIAYSYGDLTLNNLTTNFNTVGIEANSWSGDVTLTGTNNFEGNLYGLMVSTAGNVTLNNITARSNGGGLVVFSARDLTLNDFIVENNSTGIYISSSDNVSFSGGRITNNDTGLFISCVGSIDVSSTIIANNLVNIMEDNWLCPAPPPPPTPQPKTFIKPQGEEFVLDCLTVDHRYVVRLANGDRGEIFCPVNGEASINRVDNITLPANLPVGYTYASAFHVKIVENGIPVFVITEDGYITASFVAQNSQSGNVYSILYWDDKNSTWIPLKDFLLDEKGKPESFELYPGDAEDPRIIRSGVNLVTKDGVSRVEVSTNFPGVFVLAQH